MIDTKKVKKGKIVATVDCEPLWVDLVPLFCEWLEQGTESQKEIARNDILKIAKIADIVRQAQKEAKKEGEIEVTLIFKVE